MSRAIFIVFFLVFCGSFTTEKFLKIPTEGLKSVQLVLKDQLTNANLESYDLEAGKLSAFIAELNAAEEAPTLKMNITCYRFDIVYADGRVIELATNGKGIGPTPVGYFLANENLVLKYFPISKEKYCKPQNGAGAGAKKNVGF